MIIFDGPLIGPVFFHVYKKGMDEVEGVGSRYQQYDSSTDERGFYV